MTNKEKLTLERYGKACELIAQGTRIEKACKEAGLGCVTYYKYRKIHQNKPTREYTKRTKLVVTDLPTPEAPAFLIYGNAKTLAEFAREYR